MSNKNLTVEKLPNNRINYSKISGTSPLPNLVEIQTDSYDWFLKDGIREVLEEVFPIPNSSDNIFIDFVSCELNKPKFSYLECKERVYTYSAKLYAKLRLRYENTGEMKESEVFMGDIPLMTNSGSFVINGSDRVIVSQIVRSPGAYLSKEIDEKTGGFNYNADLIPSRGTWLQFETDQKGQLSVRIDRQKKLPATVFLKALGIVDPKAYKIFGESTYLEDTLEKDKGTNSSKNALSIIFQRLKQGEPVTEDGIANFLVQKFFDQKRYDLGRAGRFKYAMKLGIYNRLEGRYLAENLVSSDGEIILTKGEYLSKEVVESLKEQEFFEKGAHLKKVSANKDLISALKRAAPKGKTDEVLLTQMQEIFKGEVNTLKVYADEKKEKVSVIVGTDLNLSVACVTLSDIVAIFSYLLNIIDGFGDFDDIDNLGNRRIRCVGELVQTQFRIGLTKMLKNIQGRMSTVEDLSTSSVQSLINIKPLTSAIHEFFASSQLSQLMDQTNPLAELTNKRRISALGPGGISRDRASMAVRDVHETHYGRICPIETPEGQNIGLISNLATYAKINSYGFIETPYRIVEKGGKITNETIYLSADKEKDYIIAQGNVDVDENGIILNEKVVARRNGENILANPKDVSLIDVSPKQIVSVAASCIPFLENDDTTRALMGANMQRQALPLLKPEAPYVGTGMEAKVARDAGLAVVSTGDGEVVYVDSDTIKIKQKPFTSLYSLQKPNRSAKGSNKLVSLVNVGDKVIRGQKVADLNLKEAKNAKDSGSSVFANSDGKVIKIDLDNIHIEEEINVYKLQKFNRSNKGTCINQNSIVKVGDMVKKGDILADGPAMDSGDLALGQNVTIAFMTWDGYNYEDAVVMSERLVKDDTYTSIHIETYQCDCRETKLGSEVITRDIPNVKEESKAFLDENGIIIPGAEVREGDILVGKTTPKGSSDASPEDKLLMAIFAEKAKDVKDSSLRVPHGGAGIVLDVKILSRENGDDLPPGVQRVIRVFIVQKRKISEGDKMSGRHGNKGVISRILPVEDMPFLADGTPVDIMLNPLGVPSRMNIGQILEIHLGLACKKLGLKIATPVFDGISDKEIFELMDKAQIDPDGKTILYDGRTGERFDERISVGVMYMIKLVHMVDDKLHARATGPYSLVTQQPLGGKAQFGGQRFGEMEVWALEAYGAAYTLQEILTVKSDDTVGRVKTYEAIVKGQNVPKPGIPESFKVLIKELQSLCLDVKVLNINNEEIDLKQTFDEDEEIIPRPISDDETLFTDDAVEDGDLDDFIIEDGDDEGDSVDLEDDDDEVLDFFEEEDEDDDENI